MKNCNFERYARNEIRYVVRHCMYLNCCFSFLIQSSFPIYVIAFVIQKVLWEHFSWYFSFSEPYGMYYISTRKKLKFESFFSLISLALNSWWFMVNLLISNEYKVAFLTKRCHNNLVIVLSHLMLNLNSELNPVTLPVNMENF